MFEQLKYINHINEVIEFGKNGVFVNQNELHDYSWKYKNDNNIISSFSREIKPLALPVVIACPDPDEGVRAINNLMEIAEKDVLSNEAGRFVIGDYYFRGYITRSKKRKYKTRRGWLHADLEVVSDYPAWIKETTSKFTSKSGASGKNLDFPHDFPYDFTAPNTVDTLINDNFTDTDFKIVIYGEVENPSITIGDALYKVNCRVNRGEYLTIDSKSKTVYITEDDGDIVNRFADREKSAYIFQKIPSGEHKILWDGVFDFDVTLYEERSEPKWI